LKEAETETKLGTRIWICLKTQRASRVEVGLVFLNKSSTDFFKQIIGFDFIIKTKLLGKYQSSVFVANKGLIESKTKSSQQKYHRMFSLNFEAVFLHNFVL